MHSGVISSFIRLVVIGGIVFTAVDAAQSQTTKTSTKNRDVNRATAGRTPWGDPDLQGVYSNDDFKAVPFERPVEMGEKKYLAEEEYAKRVQVWQQQLQVDQSPTYTNPNRGETTLERGNFGYWGNRPKPQRQTSLVIDPPDGRIPYRDGKRPPVVPRQDGSRGPVNSPEELSMLVRCISAGVPWAMIRDNENNTVRIIQAPGLVMITYEVMHDTRIIPLDGRAHVSPEIRYYFGDSRGHWEGDTLVVDVTNFNDKASFRGSGPDLRVTERFTRIDANTLLYQATMDDPATFTRPWTVQVEFKRSSQQFEYACHEGNYAMANMLSGSRADEKRAADGKK